MNQNINEFLSHLYPDGNRPPNILIILNHICEECQTKKQNPKTPAHQNNPESNNSLPSNTIEEKLIENIVEQHNETFNKNDQSPEFHGVKMIVTSTAPLASYPNVPESVNSTGDKLDNAPSISLPSMDTEKEQEENQPQDLPINVPTIVLETSPTNVTNIDWEPVDNPVAKQEQPNPSTNPAGSILWHNNENVMVCAPTTESSKTKNDNA